MINTKTTYHKNDILIRADNKEDFAFTQELEEMKKLVVETEPAERFCGK
jgi:hypothetical protein